MEMDYFCYYYDCENHLLLSKNVCDSGVLKKIIPKPFNCSVKCADNPIAEVAEMVTVKRHIIMINRNSIFVCDKCYEKHIKG